MNFDLLTSDVPKSEAKRFEAVYRQPGKQTETRLVMIITAGLLLLFGMYLNSLIPGAGIVGFVAVFTLIIVAIIVILVYQGRQSIDRARRGVRIQRFAQSNGWLYRAYAEKPPYGATLFSVGDDYVFEDVVTSKTFEAGSVTFYTGSGRSRRQYRYGYMVMPLERHLPHMILDGKSNNMRLFGADISNLPMEFKNNQIDLLEGDFNEHYTLYAPEDYGTDVRYVFTPDLMSLLVSESDSIDIEIIDNEVYVYFGSYILADQTFWQRAMRLHDSLRDKLVEQAGSRYADARTSDGSLTREGARLKRGGLTTVTIFLLIYGIGVVVLKIWTGMQ